eukprot:TRINITY_DN8076_c0_g1_i2.p1 TRINITY_DN8076_c0_g1~~TRINITY_DN8076_c0_g1_i2.p1  ORF type:complete len:273 (-),score=38.82 TRINITY_DN8076_c0_g1_i2:45-863(-)
MKITLDLSSTSVPYIFDLSKPHDISIPLRFDADQVNCFYLSPAKTEAVVAGTFVGDTRRGGSVNCEVVTFSPHGSSTHTECVGHISNERITISDVLRDQPTLVPATIISVTPEAVPNRDSETVISLRSVEEELDKWRKNSRWNPSFLQALIIRTYPNPLEKCNRKYSGTNPPYLAADAAEALRKAGVRHLLVDLPSLDHESDSKLLAHCAFFHFDKNSQQHKSGSRSDNTATELCYVPDVVADGLCLLDLQVTPLQLDAAPSKPVVYPLIQN